MPPWLALRVGQKAYVPEMQHGSVQLCDSARAALNKSPTACVNHPAGSNAQVISWKTFSRSGLSVPTAYVRYGASSYGWIQAGALVPIVPTGTEVLVGGSLCEKQLGYTRSNVDLHDSTGLYSICKATVQEQLLSVHGVTFVAKYVKSGDVVRASAGYVLYPIDPARYQSWVQLNMLAF